MKTNLGLLVGALAFTGCAHAPPPATTDLNRSQSTAAAPVARAEKPAPAPTPTADQDLDSVLHGQVLHFAFDEAQLTSDSEQRLQKLAEVMKEHADLKLTVAGNCDELGTEEYNLELGQKRAAAAQSYLANLGIDRSRVATVSYGKERPVSSGHDEQARAANRRDDLSLQHL